MIFHVQVFLVLHWKVTEQRSSPELCIAIKTKMHLKQKKMNSKSVEYGDVLCFWLPAPPHGMYPGVSSYGMEADPPRFLYLKDEYFLMTDWYDIDISLIMKNSNHGSRYSIIEPHHQKTKFMPYTNKKGADLPVHPHSLIGAFVVRCIESIILLVSGCYIQNFKTLASFCSWAGRFETYSGNQRTTGPVSLTWVLRIC